MQKIRYLAAFIIITVLTAAVFAACKKQTTGNINAELSYGFSSEPSTLDPLKPSNTADGRSILFNVFEGLVKPDSLGNLQPCIAESWSIDENNLIYDFHLRNNVHFHDGSHLNSDDVKYTLETTMAAGFPGFTDIMKIETTGSMNIRIYLKNPDPEFLPYLTVGIVKNNNDNRDKNINGTGPYYIDSYEMKHNMVLKRFHDYWKLAPKNKEGEISLPRQDVIPLEKITIYFLENIDDLIHAIKTGIIDGASLTGAQVRQLDYTQFDITPYHSASVQLLAINNALKPFNNVKVRKAINYSIDKLEIIDKAFYGMGDPSGSPLIPGLRNYYDPSLRDPYPLNIPMAKSLLSEAGYGSGRNQKTLSMKITVPSNYEMHIDTAQIIVEQLLRSGIHATIQQIDWASWLSDVYNARNFEATVISLDAANLSPRSFLSRYCSDADNNFINYNNAEFDSVYKASLNETDMEKRITLYKEAQRIISDSAASVFIQDITVLKVFRRGAFGGIVNYPLHVIDFASMYSTGK